MLLAPSPMTSRRRIGMGLFRDAQNFVFNVESSHGTWEEGGKGACSFKTSRHRLELRTISRSTRTRTWLAGVLSNTNVYSGAGPTAARQASHNMAWLDSIQVRLWTLAA